MHQVEPTAILNSGSVPVEMEGCEDVRLKQRTGFWLAEKFPPIAIRCLMRAVYRGNVLR